MCSEKFSVRSLTRIALGAVLIAVCAWITVPGPVPFTLQTFGVYAALLLSGGRDGTAAVLLYLLIGAIGLPVFSGFRGGIGVLLGHTGGYLVGFLFCALTVWGLTKLLPDKIGWQALSLFLGTVVCYAFGTAWFVLVSAGKREPVGVLTALAACVLPFVIPDALKGALALFLSKRLRPLLSRSGGRRS